MTSAARFLSPSEAAHRLGVSAKALRLYEQRGLLSPARTAAGWRAYGPDEMARGARIAALRRLGLSLAQVARVLAGHPEDLGPALAAHAAALEGRARELAATIEEVRRLRSELDLGRTPALEDLARLLAPAPGLDVEFWLPWPWGGERFALRGARRLNYIVGPLGSGKTRLARRLAEVLPAAAFLGLDRSQDGNIPARLAADPALGARVDQALAWLVDDGATASAALTALLAGLEAPGPAALVVDMVEDGLDEATQQAVIAHLRRRTADGRPLFMITRSCAVLDLAAVGADESIILCPANHSPPSFVASWPGALGYEAVATCLASPAVRARTQGVIAWRPPQTAGNP